MATPPNYPKFLSYITDTDILKFHWILQYVNYDTSVMLFNSGVCLKMETSMQNFNVISIN